MPTAAHRPAFLPFASLCLAAALLAACASAPNDLDSPGAGMVQLGNQMSQKGERAAALDFYARALERDPKNVPAHKAMAQLLEQMGDSEGAGQHYREVALLRPKDGEAQRGFGRLLMMQGDYAGAKKAFEAALDDNSDDARAMTGLGVALEKLGEHKAAQKKFEKAVRLDPQDLAALNNLAYAKLQEGRPQDAIQLLEPQGKNPKASAALRQNLALAYGLAGMDIDAERVAKMDMSPDKVRKNMAYYRAQREAMALSAPPYAALGSYATQALAEAEIPALKAEMKSAGVALTPTIRPELTSQGGTPTFALRLEAKEDPESPQKFCTYLQSKGKACGVGVGE